MDYKVLQRWITKSDGTGLEITKYDRAGLQNVIGFGLKSATKIVKNGLQNAMRLQSDTKHLLYVILLLSPKL